MLPTPISSGVSHCALNRRSRRAAPAHLLPCILAVLLAACSTTRMKEAADKEAYGAIREKAADVPNMDEHFTIDQDQAWDPSAGLPIVETQSEELGEAGAEEVGARIISLEKALEIAVHTSRAYQNKKESLYLQALALTLDRHKYTPLPKASAGAQIDRDTQDVSEASDFAKATGFSAEFIDQLEQLTGQPADLLNAYQQIVEEAGALAGLDETETHIKERKRASGGASVGVDWLLRSGAQIAVGLTTNFLRFLTGDPNTSTTSALAASITQPLLRGRGAKYAAEQLTQAERDLLYALREFAQYRKEFTVDVCSQYYSVLESRDVVRNSYRALQNFRRSVARERALHAEGRSKTAALGRLEREELSQEGSWVNAIRQYRGNLDRYKIQLGLSTDAAVILDDGELESLRASGLQHPALTAEDAIEVALSARLDLYTNRDRVDDADRKVKLAANALQPGLDLVLSGGIETPPNGNYDDLDVDRGTWSAGFDLDLDPNKKAERNSYRAALIDKERALREYSLATDNIKLAVRDRWRSLEQARRSYEIALKSVELNSRRVEEQELLAELGRATVLDQVDAQNALTESQNDLTSAIVSHTIARIEFWRDMGILFIKENGQWEEVVDAGGFQHLQPDQAP